MRFLHFNNTHEIFELIKSLKEKAEIGIVVNSDDINANKIRNDTLKFIELDKYSTTLYNKVYDKLLIMSICPNCKKFL